MFWNLLTNTSSNNEGDSTGTIIFFVVMIGLIVVFSIFSRRSQRKRQEEVNATLDAMQPGNKVKTIGGICGVVVELCPEDGTFILETGSESTGKSYLKLDKKSVYQTDAVAPTQVEEAPVEEVEEAPVEEAAEEPVFEEETPATEESAE